jgi:hypothetical protein
MTARSWSGRVERLKRQAHPVVAGALARLDPDRSVAVMEYKLQPRARYGWGRPPHAELSRILAAADESADAVVTALLDLAPQLHGIPRARQPDGGLAWDNDYWGGVDALAHYHFLAQRRPATYIEVGSGYSTMFARKAISDQQLPTRIVSIDPQPRASIDAICDEMVRRPLEDTDLSRFAALKPGDIAVIDGTHTVFMNSDTVAAFLDVLPAIPPEVLVCIDDIFLPWDYPEGWADRWYGEQYLLAGMLLAGADGWSVRFPAWYVTQESVLKGRLDPLWERVEPVAGRYAKSFWMERV